MVFFNKQGALQSLMAKSPDDLLTVYGTLITSDVEIATLKRVAFKKEDKRFALLTAEDVVGENSISVYKESFPLFATDKISYKGQIIGALFGPSIEAVEAKLLDVAVELEEDPNGPACEINHQPVEYRWGDIDKFFKDQSFIYENTYFDKLETSARKSHIQVESWLDKDLLKIKAPTQWPFHLRDNVASVCNRTQKSVVVFPMDHFSSKDEKVIFPSIVSAICALATIKFKKRVQINLFYQNYKSPTTIKRKTEVDEEGKPVAEQVSVVIDQGYYSLFGSELVKQVLAGIVPLYPLSAFDASIRLVSSNSPMSHFFGDLGYSSALFSTEAHASAIARNFKTTPSSWRIKYYQDSKEQAKVLKTPPLGKLRDLITETSNISNFARHCAAYTLQRNSKDSFSTFVGYSPGIGLASGTSISGFSYNSFYYGSSKISVTLDTDNQIVVNSSFYPRKRNTDLWRSIIAHELSVDEQTVRFTSNDTSTMVDSGPQVLSLDIERAAKVIVECCRLIKSKRFQEPLPITESVTFKGLVSGRESFFSSRNWGAIVVELGINTVTLEAELRRVWGRFAISHPPDIKALELRYKHIINETLEECNIKRVFKESTENSFNINIEPTKEGQFPSLSTSSLRALVMAATASALSQALNKDITSLPVSSEELLPHIKGVKGES
jgi:CO/xanthine dehydrogenase Mo-binding subunit